MHKLCSQTEYCFCGPVYNTVSNEDYTVPYGGWLMTESQRIWKEAAMASSRSILHWPGRIMENHTKKKTCVESQ